MNFSANDLPSAAERAAVAVIGVADNAVDRQLAGVSALGRIVHEFAAAGQHRIEIAVPPTLDLARATRADVKRIADLFPTCEVAYAAGEGVDSRPKPSSIVAATEYIVRSEDIRNFLHGAHDVLTYQGTPVLWRGGTDVRSLAGLKEQRVKTAIQIDDRATQAILKTAGKASDGLVSRWINRPISRTISGLLLRFPGIRPGHATVGTAALAVAMVIFLLTGTPTGLVVGALLFQSASVFDGVDGEIARLTFRSSKSGAALDASIDMATNVLFLIGLTANLYLQGYDEALYLGSWAVVTVLVGLFLIGRTTVQSGQPLGFDLLKRRASGDNVTIGQRIVSFFTIVTSRDFFAFAFALLILAGVPMLCLYLLTSVGSIWLGWVVYAVVRRTSVGSSSG